MADRLLDDPAVDSAAGGIFIALGSNLGDRAHHLRAALIDLDRLPQTRLLRCSTIHETAPVDSPGSQTNFRNAVAEVATGLSPQALLRQMLAIEIRHGRMRTVRNGPRTLDLDLLLYRELVIDEPDLIVPHPRMWQRAFVLDPLHELCSAERLTRIRAALNQNRNGAHRPTAPDARDVR